jgi:uncharacterized protein YukE
MAAHAANRVEAMETGLWMGEAADVFADRFTGLAPRFRETSEHLGSAVRVLEGWSEAVATARARIASAIALYQQGMERRRWWLENRAALEAASGVSLPDPGVDVMAEAERRVEQARDQLDVVSRRTEAGLRGVADQALNRFSIWSDLGHAIGGFWSGAADAIGGLAELGWRVSPLRAVSDPEGTVDDLSGVINGAAGAVGRFWNDPGAVIVEGAKELVGFDQFVSDPARWTGQILPDAAATVAGVGMARRAGRLAEDLMPAGPDATSVSAVIGPTSSAEIEQAMGMLPVGNQSWVHLVDTDRQLRELFAELARGGAPAGIPTYPGQFVRVPDGATVGIRPDSTTGGATIDIRLADRTELKIHLS